MPALAPSSRSGVTAKQAPSSVLSNGLITLTVPLSQHTASVCTFENMVDTFSVLPTGGDKKAGCSHSSSKKHGKSELCLLSRSKLKMCSYVSVATLRWHFT